MPKVPKVPKIEVRLRRIDFIKRMERSDAPTCREPRGRTILGTLGILAQFRHLMDFTIGA